MELNNDPLSGAKSLELIEEMIYKAKNSYHESGTSALLWGSTVMLCSAVSFINTWLKIDWLYKVWWLTLLAVIPQIIISIKESKAQKFKSHTDDAMGGVWISFGVAIFLLSFCAGKINLGDAAACLFLILYGMPTFATGFTYRFTEMIIGGVVCWVCAVISLYVSQPIDFMLFFVSAFFAWLLPGLVLRRDYLRKKRENV